MVVVNGKETEEKQGTDRYVAVPRMNAICHHLAEDLQVEYQTKVIPPRSHQGRWLLSSDQGANLGEYDTVIISAPAAQTAQLLVDVPELAQQANSVEMSGCWAAMVALDASPDVGFDAAFIQQSTLSWIARNSSKPKRSSESETWILHASSDWSETNLEQSAAEVEAALLKNSGEHLVYRRSPFATVRRIAGDLHCLLRPYIHDVCLTHTCKLAPAAIGAADPASKERS